MSDRPIQVGDLVCIVMPSVCCGVTRSIGFIYRVVSLNSADSYKCRNCGNVSTGVVADQAYRYGADVRRLRRIPPLSELEGQRTQEDMREPA